MISPWEKRKNLHRVLILSTSLSECSSAENASESAKRLSNIARYGWVKMVLRISFAVLILAARRLSQICEIPGCWGNLAHARGRTS